MRKKETGGRVAGPAFASYYKEVLRLYPHVKRKFDQPEGVREIMHAGVKEYFTDISRPPSNGHTTADPEEGLLF
jgi:penicillin-binding protein 1A